MTSTDKKVTRVTSRSYPPKLGLSGNAWGKPRAIMVTIMPGDTLVLRPKGLRTREYVSIVDVFHFAQTRRMRSEAAQSLNFRRRARRTSK